jgi:hypothetical protein
MLVLKKAFVGRSRHYFSHTNAAFCFASDRISARAAFLTQTGAHKINLSSVNDVESEHLTLMNILNRGTAV